MTPIAGNRQEGTASTSAQTAASLVLSDFFALQAHGGGSGGGSRPLPPSPATLLTSATTLLALIRNATKIPIDPTRRTVRLSNPKVRARVVAVPFALDVLCAAGFERMTVDGEELLVMTAGDDNEAAGVVEHICVTLETHIEEMKRSGVGGGAVKQNEARPVPAPAPLAGPTEEEMRERKRRAAQARKAREAERAEARSRWEEDKAERSERKKKAVSARKASGDEAYADGVTIHPLGPTAAAAATQGGKPTVFGGRVYASEAAAARAEAAARRAGVGAPHSVVQGAAAVPDGGAAMDVCTEDERNDGATKGPTLVGHDKGPERDMDPTEKQTKTAFASANVASMHAAAAAPPPSFEKRGLEAVCADSAPSGFDSKPAAKPAAEGDDKTAEKAVEAWLAATKGEPRCCSAEGIRESSSFHNDPPSSFDGSSSGTTRRPGGLRRLLKELSSLNDSLPCDPQSSLWVRFDEETPRYMRALITAPPGTPYGHGAFLFDIHVPDEYPQIPPNIRLLTTGNGTVRFGPNLYADGKVCLSLLGTWSGPGWDPARSTIAQVLISIQGLVLGVEHPFYLEPGHGGWEGQVKEGDFASTGHTLKGDVVREDINLPTEVRHYDDALRVGTARFAILEVLESLMLAATGTPRASSSGGGTRRWVRGFQAPLVAHFRHNRDGILAEVRAWADSAASTANPRQALPQGHDARSSLEKLLPQIEDALDELPETLPADGPETEGDVNQEGILPAPAKEGGGKPASAPDKAAGSFGLPKLRQQMQDAASAGNFILAGRLQEQVQALELSTLRQRMQDAASAGDFILAGRLQEQVKALEQARDCARERDEAKGNDSEADGIVESDDDEEEEDNHEVGWEDKEWDNDDSGFSGLPLGAPSFGLPPSGHPLHPGSGDGTVGAAHGWGSGNQLGTAAEATPSTLQDVAPFAAASAATPLAEAAARKPSPAAEARAKAAARRAAGNGAGFSAGTSSAQVPAQGESASAGPSKSPTSDRTGESTGGCCLRIRLPDSSQSVVGNFAPSDTLLSVYRYLAPFVVKNGESAAPPMSFSSSGFTLLLARPRSEFILEIHGPRTLEELGLVPSATLVVMMCTDRGVVRRGELESRIDGAEGDAMDVDGLTYEGLVELTERVGVAAQESGAGVDAETLDAVSTLVCAADVVRQLGVSTPTKGDVDSSSGEEDGSTGCRCPICLVEFDPTETECKLRKLERCSHVFHATCVGMWFRTKSTCPLCKEGIN